jgi:hypothetical protein
MRAHELVDRCRFAAPLVFLISVLGVLFVLPLRAAPELTPSAFRIEIDLGSPHEWPVRASGPVLVGADGAFNWPLRHEGFSTVVTTSMSHRKVGDEAPPHHVSPATGLPGDGMPSARDLGYQPGERVEIAFVRRIRPLAEGGLDQAFMFAHDGHDVPVTVEMKSLRPGIRFSQIGLSERGGTFELLGERKHFDVPAGQKRASPLHEFSTAPRLFLSSYPDYLEIGRAQNAALARADRALSERAARLAAPDAPIHHVVESLLADLRSREGTAADRAGQLRAMLDSRGIEAHLVFTNRRAILALPEVPVGMFDTVMVAVPALRMMLDPVRLSQLDIKVDPELAGRDALILRPDGGKLEKLPLLRASDNKVFIRAELQIMADGAIKGQSLTESSGLAASKLQKLLHRLRDEPQEASIAKILQQQSLDGEARLGPTDQRGDVIGQHLTFRLLPQAGGDTVMRVPTIPGPRLFKLPFVELVPALKDQNVPFVFCQAVTIEHHIVLHLPDKRMLVEQPKDITVAVPMGTYMVRYSVEPTRVIVRRRLEFEPRQAFCSREQVLEMAPLIRAASRDLARQLHLRLPTG